MKKLLSFLCSILFIGNLCISAEEIILIKSAADLADTTKVENHHVIWDDSENAPYFDGVDRGVGTLNVNQDGSYIKLKYNPFAQVTAESGFTMRFKAKLDGNNTGNGWCRIIEFSKGRDSEHVFLLAEGTQTTTQHLEIQFFYEDDGRTVNNFIQIKRTDMDKKYFGAWHEYYMVVTKEGNVTLYVDNEPVSYVVGSSVVRKVLAEISTYDTVYLGASIWTNRESSRQKNETQVYAAKDGYFKGWIKDYTIIPDSSKGAWDGQTHSVTFNSNGGSSVATLTGLTSLPATLPVATKGEGKHSIWYYDQSFTKKANPGDGLNSDITLYAKYEDDFFELGELSYENGVGYLKNIRGGNSNLFKGCTVSFAGEINGNEKIVLPTVSGFTNAGFNTDVSATFNSTASNGTSLENFISYIKQIQFQNCTNINQKVIITLSENEVENLTLFCANTGHFYQYVQTANNPSLAAQHNDNYSWKGAYNTAASKTFAGRQGYLVTVTSVEEDLFLLKASGNKVSWIAGTTLKNSGVKNSSTSNLTYTNFNYNNQEGLDNYNDYWYWACGPEIGEKFFDTQTINNDTSGDALVRNEEKGYYFNWGFPSAVGNYEPNSGGREACATILSFGSGYKTKDVYKHSIPESANNTDAWGTGTSWNNICYDLPGTIMFRPTGYFIEYGDLRYGDSHGESVTTGKNLCSSVLITNSNSVFTINVTAINGTATGSGTYHYGDLVTVNVTANNPGSFYFWKDYEGNNLSSSKEYKFTASKNMTLIANCGVVYNENKQKCYQTLEAAVSDASVNDEIKLLLDINDTKVTFSKNVIINGNNKKLIINQAVLSGGACLKVKGTFTTGSVIKVNATSGTKIYNNSVEDGIKPSTKLIVPYSASQKLMQKENSLYLMGNAHKSSW